VFAFARYGADAAPVVVASNMTPVPRHGYRIGVPLVGAWREIFNSDSAYYGGSNVGNDGRVEALPIAAHGQAQSVELVLPPLATIYLRHDG
jgi:1,4-alpha-glucan branching enzyme